MIESSIWTLDRTSQEYTESINMSRASTTEQLHSKAYEQEVDIDTTHRTHGPSIDIALATPDYSPEVSCTPTTEQGTAHDPLTSRGHMGGALENLAQALTNTSSVEAGEDTYELRPTPSHRASRKSPNLPTERRRSSFDGLAEEAGSPTQPISQTIPPELGTLTKEIVFVLVCSSGQLLFAFLQGDINVNQQGFKHALGLQSTQLPWLVGSFLVALGLSVIVAGSLTDLVPPKLVVVGAFAWLTIWNVIGAFSLVPSRSVLFFVMRAMQGLSVGILVSGSMSILGRVYNPGQRKTRVFSTMAAMAPFGFW